MTVLLPVRVLSAAVAMVSGAIALLAAKGGMLHRKSGLVFAYAMTAMCGTAVVVAAAKGQGINLVAAIMTAYLVLTGVLTVRTATSGSRRRDIFFMGVALGLGSAMLIAGFVAVASPNSQLFGYPAFPFFLFGVLGLAAALETGAWSGRDAQEARLV